MVRSCQARTRASFASAARRDAASEDALEPDETLHEALEEAEHDLGLADWVDPETGDPAAQAGPRLEDH